MAALPPFAPYPKAPWRRQLSSSEFDSLLEAWLLLSRATLNLSEEDFKKKASQDESLSLFSTSFLEEEASSSTSSSSSSTHSHSIPLLKTVFQLCARLFKLPSPPTPLLHYTFLADLSRVYPKKHTTPVIAQLFANHPGPIETSLTSLKKLLIPHLDKGINGDLKLVESHLLRLNPLLHVSPHSCVLCLAGSDFFDGLVAGFRVMNPPLRKAIIATVYLCLVGLTEAEPPRWAMLNDQLYTLKAAADTHKAGPLNVNDSLVPELVTSTPILKVLLKRAETSDAATASFKNRVRALEEFKKGPMVRPKRLVRRKVDKGKGRQTREDAQAEMHVHQLSKITQVQDLFPDLGAGFVSKCLDEYGEDVEQVVANLLGESLPPHLASADRTEPLSSQQSIQPEHKDLAPRSTPPLLPQSRRNVYDDDEFDRLTMDVSKVSFGKNTEKTAKQLQSTAPNKAAIMSALAAFDSDDDERDDTYDAADVGGTVDAANQEADGVSAGNEETLYRAYQMDEKVFQRDPGTRRGPARNKLREETGMTDEAIEGWAVMLNRNPQQKRRLEAKYAFRGEQQKIERTSWRPSPAGSGAEDSSDAPGGGPSRGGARGGRGRGRGRGGGGGRGRGGNVAGPTGEKETEQARRNKESNKGSRANHNRRDARAKKLARGGFAG